MESNERRWSFPSLLVLLLAALLCTTLPGCSGCWNQDPTAKKKEDDENAKKKKKKIEKPKENFELPVAAVLPNDPNLQLFEEAANGEQASKTIQVSRVKPGHWVAVSQFAKANNFDFAGQLRTAAVNSDGQPLDVEHTNFQAVCERPVSLPKGQGRPRETFFYLPHRLENTAAGYTLRTELQAANGGATQITAMLGGTKMKENEFFMVVLASNPSAYTYIDRLNSVALTASELDSATLDGGGRFYEVSLPRVDRRAPLPSHPLAWTMIAYLVWDDANPEVLNEEQRQALVDWLHWGGQLIISGPNSLDKLKGSFLAPYLPAQAGATREYTQADVDELSNAWSLTSRVDPNRLRGIRIPEKLPMLGVELKLHQRGNFVPNTGKLVAERRVGGGRTVVTSFSLTDLRITKWKGFDNFFNACLLRRPGREFGANDYGEMVMKWALPIPEPTSKYSNDPRLTSTVRYFSRDGGYLPDQAAQAQQALAAAKPVSIPPVDVGVTQPLLQDDPLDAAILVDYGFHPDIDDWHFNGYQRTPNSGVAGWNDLSAVATAARSSLVEAAGIEIPEADFVLKTLAIYLLVLVPLNWFVFRMLGRVEWAWAAAPVIAIIGAVAVIRLAQLDIGFARSRTEVGVLELQGGYPRGHLTRYTAFYTSLASNYRLMFDDATALALPFSDDLSYQRPFTRQPIEVVLRRDDTIALNHVLVGSNSTALVHSEQMLPVGGGLTLVGDDAKGYQVFNRTSFTLRDVGVVRKTTSGELQSAYVGEIKPQAAAPLKFVAVEGEHPWFDQWDKSPVMRRPDDSRDSKGQVRLGDLARLAVERLRITPGDVRLVGWTDEEIPGMTVEPHAPQSNSHTMVVAHLQRGALHPPESDKNVADDYRTGINPDESEPDAGQTAFPSS